MTGNAGTTLCFRLFAECVRAVDDGNLIESVSAKDKEFHFQNWVEQRLDQLGVNFDGSGRNTYPDFSLVGIPEGYEIKGLAWPGRERDYDSNSQVPTGQHNGRQIYYVFGRYPADPKDHTDAGNGKKQYPLVDLVICHGDFLNADHKYVHKNKSVKGFGTYGDLMIRDRKMYVAPTPFALTDGTTGLLTIIVPEACKAPPNFQLVGNLTRTEAAELVVGYSFDLQTNEIRAVRVANPNAGTEHRFCAYRLTTQSSKRVTMMGDVASLPLGDEE